MILQTSVLISGEETPDLNDVPPAGAVHEQAGLLDQLVRPRPGELRHLALDQSEVSMEHSINQSELTGLLSL